MKTLAFGGKRDAPILLPSQRTWAAATLSAATGQILRQRCGETRRINGTSGTMPCQNRSSNFSPCQEAFMAKLAATPTTAKTAVQREKAKNRFTAFPSA